MAKTHVVQAQTALAAAGYYKGKIDGDFGGGSLRAVQNLIDNTDKAVDILSKPDTGLKPVGELKLSKRGADLMKRYEGFSSAPYIDMVGVTTIGYGNTYYPDRRKVKMTDKHLTEPQAAQLAMDIINLDFAPAVNKIFKDEIASGKLNQNMFDALVSLAYNIGTSALANSNSVTGNIKKGNYQAAADGFLLWNKGRVNGKLQAINGLTRRRTEERDLFLS